ncbi:hypothetical protein [Caulobacter sp. S45]|uniref:hypothetical protein n=1 Tax=Caulobacter sp. S45 TaxID=1641861 RepID=UPI001C2D4501|nr:hypothetical protein [Caulobacter sp. S45]
MDHDDPTAELDAPELVHWSPRHGPTVGGPIRPLALPFGSFGLVAVFGLAVGALAVGALAIGRLAVGDARLGRVRIDQLEVGELTVTRRNGRPF